MSFALALGAVERGVEAGRAVRTDSTGVDIMNEKKNDDTTRAIERLRTSICTIGILKSRLAGSLDKIASILHITQGDDDEWPDVDHLTSQQRAVLVSAAEASILICNVREVLTIEEEQIFFAKRVLERLAIEDAKREEGTVSQ